MNNSSGFEEEDCICHNKMSAKRHEHAHVVPRVGSGISLASASTDHGHTATSNSSNNEDDGQIVVNPQKKAKKPLKKVT